MELDRKKLWDKITILNETIWDSDLNEEKIKKWLSNFKGNGGGTEDQEQLIALYLLTKFSYFGLKEIREIIRIFYRELILHPMIIDVRASNNWITDLDVINRKVWLDIFKTRIIGIGNPSESGNHLLYYLRQESSIDKDFFINSHEVFEITENREISLRDKRIERYIFIDDICGTGDQAIDYSNDIVYNIKKLNPDINVQYLTLFSTQNGINRIQENSKFDVAKSLFSLDESYQCFGNLSRYFPCDLKGVTKEIVEEIFTYYGELLYPDYPLGYKDAQLLIGFHHNVPDNTLPTFWESKDGWYPIFKRYQK